MSRNRWAQQRCLGPYQPAFFEGDVVQITLVPDQPLTIPTYAGPSLKIRFLDRYSDYSNFEGLRTVSFQPSKSSNQALVFEYTVKKGDADFDGYQIESTSLDGITGITATGNGKQLLPLIFTENPIFALDENGRQDTDPDAVKLPPVDAVGVVQVDHSLRDCPFKITEGDSVTCILTNLSVAAPHSDIGIFPHAELRYGTSRPPPYDQYEWQELEQVADDTPGGVIMELLSPGWVTPQLFRYSNPGDPLDKYLISRWTVGTIGVGGSARVRLTVEQDSIPENPKTFIFDWQHTFARAGLGTNGVYIIVVDDDPPAAPKNLVAAPGDARVTLTWDESPDSTIAGYKLTVGKGSDTTDSEVTLKELIVDSGASTVSYVVEGLDNDVDYHFFVQARNGVGLSRISNRASTTPRAPEITVSPSGPVNLWENDPAQLFTVEGTAVWDPQSYGITVQIIGTTSIDDVTFTDNNNRKMEPQKTADGSFSLPISVEDVASTDFTFEFYLVANTDLVEETGEGLSIQFVAYKSDADATSVLVASPLVTVNLEDVAFPPEKPDDLSATPGDQMVSLAWRDPVNLTISGYQYRQNPGSATTAIG